MMAFHFSTHTVQEMHRRGLSRQQIEAVLSAPEQIVPEHGEILCYQSRLPMQGKTYLLRVMVNPMRQPPEVVTVYRTSKITKYWRQP